MFYLKFIVIHQRIHLKILISCVIHPKKLMTILLESDTKTIFMVPFFHYFEVENFLVTHKSFTFLLNMLVKVVENILVNKSTCDFACIIF